MARFIYLSYFLGAETPLYGGGKGISILPDRVISSGDTANTKMLHFQNHSGTHVDFPNHFFDEGATSDLYDASFWVFEKPYLLKREADENEIIQLTKQQLEEIPDNTDIIIYRSLFGQYRSQEKYWKNNPGFAPNMADMLREKCPALRAIGMDFISLTSYQNREIGRAAHRCFLGGERPILLIEDMDLAALSATPSRIICSPLLVHGIDGAPVTIIAEMP